MKKQQIERLLKKYLSNEPEGFHIKGDLIYKVADKNILHGILFEDSTFDKNQLAVNVFIQLLYVPADSIKLTIGFRIRSKSGKEWWAVQSDSENEIFSEISECIKAEAMPYFKKAMTSEMFYKAFRGTKNKSIREQQSLTICAIMINHPDAKEAVNTILKMAQKKEYKELDWVHEICENIQKLYDADDKKRKEILEVWNEYTVRNIKIDL